MAIILITGGTGLIGTRLSELLLQEGHEVIVLTRKALPQSKLPKGIRHAKWDIDAKYIDPQVISSADYILHLAGAGVADKRWDKKRKEEIVNSRVAGGLLLVEVLKNNPNKVQAVISASGIGWYGNDTDKSKQLGFTEESPADTSFLGETCRLWEESMQGISDLGKRLVIFRFGIVLTNKGGALPEFKKPIKLGIAAILGSGEQNVSWIHIDDLCNMLMMAIKKDSITGVYNAVAPEVVTNKVLTISLAKSMKRFFFIPFQVPVFLLKLAMGEMSIEVLKSAKVNSYKIQGAGFHFRYPTLDEAIKELIHPL